MNHTQADNKIVYRCPDRDHCMFHKNCTALITPEPLASPLPMYIKCMACGKTERLIVVGPKAA